MQPRASGKAVASARTRFSGPSSSPNSAGLAQAVVAVFRLVFDDVSGLAIQRPADRFQGREADAADLAGFQQGEIGFGDADGARQHVGAHAAPGHHHVEGENDRHQMISALSCSISRPNSITCAIANTMTPRMSASTSSPRNQALSVPPASRKIMFAANFAKG